MKKSLLLITLAMVVAFALCLVGCNSSASQESSTVIADGGDSSTDTSASVNEANDKELSKDEQDYKHFIDNAKQYTLGETVTTDSVDYSFSEAN